jgi:hypothetical protein
MGSVGAVWPEHRPEALGGAERAAHPAGVLADAAGPVVGVPKDDRDLGGVGGDGGDALLQPVVDGRDDLGADAGAERGESLGHAVRGVDRVRAVLVGVDSDAGLGDESVISPPNTVMTVGRMPWEVSVATVPPQERTTSS